MDTSGLPPRTGVTLGRDGPLHPASLSGSGKVCIPAHHSREQETKTRRLMFVALSMTYLDRTCAVISARTTAMKLITAGTSRRLLSKTILSWPQPHPCVEKAEKTASSQPASPEWSPIDSLGGLRYEVFFLGEIRKGPCQEKGQVLRKWEGVINYRARCLNHNNENMLLERLTRLIGAQVAAHQAMESQEK